MQSCPAEVCLQIFDFACVDDGTTGRSLSLVSRSFHELSKEAKLKSIGIIGLRQIVGLAILLRNTPPELRRIKHLFLSSMGQANSYDEEESVKEAQHAVVGLEQHYPNVCHAFEDILNMVAPTLESFYMITNIARATTFLPASLPKVKDLIIIGPFPAITAPTSKDYTYPALRNMTFKGFTDYPLDLFEDLASQCPNLKQLSFFPAQPSRNLHYDLEVALDVPRQRQQTFWENIPAAQLPSTIQQVYVQPGPIYSSGVQARYMKQIQMSMIEGLANLARRDKRIKIIKPGKHSMTHHEKLNWLAIPK